ncbi:MAG: BLUF domain-containing protein [Salibacteraceae bacterium]
MPQLHHLLYTSRRSESCTDEGIKALLNTCRANNRKTGISGVLLHSDYFFLQYIEGPECIHQLFEKIQTDSRHQEVNLINFGPIESRAFPNWQMGYKSVNQYKVQFLSNVTEEEANYFHRLLRGYPAEANSTPLRLLKSLFPRI